MPNAPRKYDQELFFLMNAIADSVEASSDAVVMAESREAGEDPQRIADDVRQLIKGVVRQFDQRHLREARTTYKEAVTRSKQKEFNFDAFTVAELRKLLESVFQQMPQYQGLITAQCRDYKDLPDEEVKSILRQLHFLGALDKVSFRK